MRRTLVTLLGTLLLTAGFAAFAECMGPYESHGAGEPPEWKGTCSEQVTEIFGLQTDVDGQHDRTRARDGSECGGEPGPNQNPDPGRVDF